MKNAEIVKNITLILSELIKLNFKVISREEGVLEHRIHLYFAMQYSDLKQKLPELASTTNLDHILQVLRSNGHVKFSDDIPNPGITITPKGVDAFYSKCYYEKYVKGKRVIDEILNAVPIVSVGLTILFFIAKDLLPIVCPSTIKQEVIAIHMPPSVPKQKITTKTLVYHVKKAPSSHAPSSVGPKKP